MVDCVVIIVAYRSGEDLPALLESVPDAVGSLSWHAIVVNNDPTEDLAPIVARYQRATLVSAGHNLGFSGGLNLGLRNAPPSRFVAFLNPDLVLTPRALEKLSEAASSDGVVAAVPAICDDAGTPQLSLRREPSILGALGEALLGDHWPRRPAWLAEMIRDREHYTQPRPVQWATGAALLVRSNVPAEIGEWDSDTFFLYSEETDYCRRIRQQVGQIRYAPDAVVHHRGAGSGSSAALAALMEVNKLRYYRKWHGLVPSLAFGAIAVMHNLVRVSRPGARAALGAIVSARARAALPGGNRQVVRAVVAEELDPR